MKIIGPDSLVFGVDDLDGCIQYVQDYGLTLVERTASGAIAEALDGTHLTILKSSDAALAAPIAPSPNLRETVYGVADKATLEAIGAELSKDREVLARANRLHSVDDDGYPIAFQVSQRRKFQAPYVGFNVPGQLSGRALNEVALAHDGDIRPRGLSHVVVFTRDKVKAERFYAERLGFRTVDAFIELGPFMRPAGTNEHHTLFFIQAPVLGVQHFTFHFASAHEVLKCGWDFAAKGYRSAWGPGRHLLGSNYFWYFNSPFGGWMEFDADMDVHDDSWKPRYLHAGADASQAYLLQYAPKWSPGPDGRT